MSHDFGFEMLEEEFDVMEGEDCEEFDPLDEDEDIFRSVRESTGIDLVSGDYNLNSPLIRDEVDAVAKMFGKMAIEDRFVWRKGVRDLLFWYRHFDEPYLVLAGSVGFHSWTSKKIYQSEWKGNKFPQFQGWLREVGEIPIEISERFLKAFCGAGSNDPVRVYLKPISDNSYEEIMIISDFEKYHFFHTVVLMLNSLSKEQRDNLLSLNSDWFVGKKEREGQNSFWVTGHHDKLGRFYISSGYMILKEQQRILDRNMILMLKDTCVARFCAKMSVLYNTNYSQTHGIVEMKKLTSFYELGDEILAAVGNMAFDVIKMIEPACNYQLIRLAGQQRPLIPQDPSFGNHVRSAISEFEENHGVSAQNWMNMIFDEQDPQMVCLYYGVFRQFGHPFLDYLEGLSKLHEQVTRESMIDERYAGRLASDLAYKVLNHEFHQKKRWFVDINQMSPEHPFYRNVKDQSWPTPSAIRSFGDMWHLLPLTACYEVPSGIDPAVLYSDKSHSLNRTDILNHVYNHPNTPIPSLKVLETTLKTPSLDVREFLQDLNDNSLQEEHLVIGLKGKEREVKRVGRYFSLMSWKLRLYFVTTEYLIKKYFVPLFNGLTMADDFTAVTRKILDRAGGHGSKNYEKITFANHFDYSKWNNTQRGKANNPVFQVMGQFLGMDKIFVRTHEFFERSLVYYNERADLMQVKDRTLICKGEEVVCWNGQAGGLEGLRQKGWSLVSLLVLEREGKIRNSLVKVLAQGDNQVVCVSYSLPTFTSEREGLQEELEHVYRNNIEIVKAIVKGTASLGLTLNEDETMVTSDYLNYGKTVLYRGNIIPLLSKRWARVTCVTNDQIPSFSNILPTVSTNGLAIAQQSDLIISSIHNYIYFALFCIFETGSFNPLLGRPVLSLFTEYQTGTPSLMTARLIFLDPSLGGCAGVSLSRFLIRQFPDPVTESLSFWKRVYEEGGSEYVSLLAISAGYPRLGRMSPDAFLKLLENPSCLNIPHSLSAQTLLRTAVRTQLIQHTGDIKNNMFRGAIEYMDSEYYPLVEFLQNINPLFPRFLSEFKASTFLGITESLVNLFQNSKTLRMIFRRKFSTKVSSLLIRSELLTLSSIKSPLLKDGKQMWKCSSSRADELREESWGQRVYGTTVPHPLEALGRINDYPGVCLECSKGPYPGSHICVCYPQGFSYSICERGPLPPYLGSTTSESTALFHPWEKEVDLPLIQKSMRLRNAINWFIERNSNLAKSIIENLNSLTGLEWKEDNISFERTGSALHRFHCSRQSAGGYTAINPNLLSYVFSTTDTLGVMNNENYDFMYQSFILYSQLVSVTRRSMHQTTDYHHLHINCADCIRVIDEIKLESTFIYRPPSAVNQLELISGKVVEWIPKPRVPEIQEGKWEEFTWSQKSFHVGTAQGLAFSLMLSNHDNGVEDQSLFPISVAMNVIPHHYLIGILNGLHMGSLYMAAFHRDCTISFQPRRVISGARIFLIDELMESPFFLNTVNKFNLGHLVKRIPHRIPPSYPVSKHDTSSIIRSFLYHHISLGTLSKSPYTNLKSVLWIFADFRTPKWTGLMMVCHELRLIEDQDFASGAVLNRLRMLKDAIKYFLESKLYLSDDTNVQLQIAALMKAIVANVRSCKEEVRHAIKMAKRYSDGQEKERDESYSRASDVTEGMRWGIEESFSAITVPLYFVPTKWEEYQLPKICRWIDPLISGLRTAQLATGAHYKIRSVLSNKDYVRDILCIGDGSGGMSSAMLRKYPHAKLIFNSLMDNTEGSFYGVTPAPPSAIDLLHDSIRSRCVNLNSCWSNPGDLRSVGTWMYFSELLEKHDLDISLIVCDMEPYDVIDLKPVIDHLSKFLRKLLNKDGTLIMKFHLSGFQYPWYIQMIEGLCSEFLTCTAVFPTCASSRTSEFYLKLRDLVDESTGVQYLHHDTFKELYAKCFANRSLDYEFERALDIKNKNMLGGVPPELIPSFQWEFTNLLISVGLESGTAALLSADVDSQHSESNMYILALVVLISVSNSVINTTRSLVALDVLPSLNDLQRHFAFFVGTWLYLSWGSEDKILYQYIHWWLDNPVAYGFCIFQCERRSRLKWSWNGQGVRKSLYKPNKLSLSGELIRLYSRLEKNVLGVQISPESMARKVCKYACLFNTGFSFDLVRTHTGLLLPLGINQTGDVSALDDSVDFDDGESDSEEGLFIASKRIDRSKVRSWVG